MSYPVAKENIKDIKTSLPDLEDIISRNLTELDYYFINNFVRGRKVHRLLFKKPSSALLIYLLGCAGSLLLRSGSPQSRQAGSAFPLHVKASHCGGLSCSAAWALGPVGFSYAGAWS